MARSGRGWGGSASALSQAAVQNAQASQQASLAATQLSAQEQAAWRQRQAANLGAAGQLGLNAAGQRGDMAQAQGQLALQQAALNDQTALGYGASDMDMGPMGTYHVLEQSGAQRAGILKAQGDAPTMWLPYVSVDDAGVTPGSSP